MQMIKEYLLDNWGEYGFGEKPDDLTFSQFPDRKIRAPEVAILTFLFKKVAQGKEAPFLVCRLPRDPGNNEAKLTLEREDINLRYVHELIADEKLRATIPRAVFLRKINDLLVLAITYLPGVEMGTFIEKDASLSCYIENSELALAWLTEFQKSFGYKSMVFNKKNGEQMIGTIIDRYRTLLPKLFSSHEAYFNKLTARAKNLAGKKLMPVPQHGDFHASNIFTIGNKITGVIDWEDFQEAGLPCFDLCHYLATYYEALFAYAIRAGSNSAIETLSEGADWRQATNKLIENYCSRLGIDQELLAVFVPIFLIKAATIAAEPRKRAAAAVKKYDLLMQLEPLSFADLILGMSALAYGGLLQKAAAENDIKTADLCRLKMQQLLVKKK